MVLVIIQARMGSTRLPGKVLAPVNGRPLLSYMLERVRRCRTVDRIVIATSTQPEDDALEAFCASEGVACFRGSREDVLDRYYQAARSYGKGAQDLAIVRLTADCPLIDPAVVDRIIDTYLARSGAVDYVSNTLQRTYPDGLDTEVFSFQALERAWKETRLPADREHVTTFIHWRVDHPPRDGVRIDQVRCDRNYAHWRWTVDYPEDLDLIRTILEALYPQHPDFGFLDVIEWLRHHPEHARRNASKALEVYRSRRLERSFKLLDAAQRLIPSATQTLSKRPTQFARGLTPLFLERSQGCRVEDVDGNIYLDYSMALSAVTLGYNDPAVTEAIKRQLDSGTVFSLPHPLEVDVAERLVALVPCAEMVRFCKNGSDATSGAIRLARAYTGRERVALCGYHGAQDWYIGTTSWNRGIPTATRELSHAFSYNDLGTLESILEQFPGEVAVVILEPVGVIPPKDGFLQGVIDLAHRHGALVIFDEIVTGFRLRLGGAQEFFGVTPDLACFGKGMANGMPLAAVVGRREIMRTFEEVFFSFTFGGEALSLAASAATIDEMKRRNVIGHLWTVGAQLQEGCVRLIEESGLSERVKCLGYPPRHVFRFLDEHGTESLPLKTLFLQETVKRGILTMGAHNLSFAHQPQDVTWTLEVYRDVFQILRQAVEERNIEEYLQVDVVEPVFRAVYDASSRVPV